MKKGWLIKQGTSEKDWKKHWFVLTGNSLRYYKDAKAEAIVQDEGVWVKVLLGARSCMPREQDKSPIHEMEAFEGVE